MLEELLWRLWRRLLQRLRECLRARGVCLTGTTGVSGAQPGGVEPLHVRCVHWLRQCEKQSGALGGKIFPEGLPGWRQLRRLLEWTRSWVVMLTPLTLIVTLQVQSNLLITLGSITVTAATMAMHATTLMWAWLRGGKRPAAAALAWSGAAK